MLSQMDITDGPSPDFTPIPYLGEQQRKSAPEFPGTNRQTQALVTAERSLLGFHVGLRSLSVHLTDI